MNQRDRADRLKPLAHAAILLACALALAICAGYFWLRSFHLPPPTGAYPVGTTILNLTDTSRDAYGIPGHSTQRQLVVQLWYPAQPSSQPVAKYKCLRETELRSFYEALLPTNSRVDARVATTNSPFPVLIFGHRWGGDRVQNTALAEDLASNGYVVVAVDHPYNSDKVMLGDGHVIDGAMDMNGPRGEQATATERITFWDQQLDVWAADDEFVLNALAAKNDDAASTFHNHFDMQRIGAFGHSFGGATSLRLCGLDPRVKAVINLDGWTFGALTNRTAAQDVMIVYEGAQVQQAKDALDPKLPDTVQHQLDRADNIAVNASLRAFGGLEVFVAGTQHLDFSDQPLLPPLRRKATGPIAPLRMNDINRALVLAFFDEALRGMPEPWLNNPHTRFQEITGGYMAPSTTSLHQ